MKNFIITCIGTLAFALFANSPAWAVSPVPVPSIYTYQGAILVDDLPFNGEGALKTVIVDRDGRTLWSNDDTSVDGSEPKNGIPVTVDAGAFVVLLGDVTIEGMFPIDPSVFATTENVYLKSWFNDDVHGFAALEPPIKITANAFSVNAQYLRGLAPDDFFLNSSQIVSGQIATGAVTSAAIAGGAVGNTQIAAGAVTDDKITAFSDARTFNVGDASGSNVQIVAAIGAANDPALRYDTAGSKWQYTNDGVAWNDIGSGGGGGVNPGLVNQLSYYAAAGSTVSGLATSANGALITSAGSVPSISQTLPNAVQDNITRLGTVVSGIWTGSVIADTYIADNLTINGGTIDNSVIGGTTAANATVQELIATLDAVIQGGDLTVGLGTTGYAGRVILHDADTGDNNTTAIQSHADVGASFALILPADGGSAGEVLTTDGASPNAQLSWSAAASGDVTGPGSSTDNAIPRFDGTGGKTLQGSGVIISDATNDMSGIGALSITSMGAPWDNSSQAVTNMNIDSGTIDGVDIGGGTAADGTFLDLVASTFLLGTTNQGDVLYDNGTGIVRLAPGTSGQFLQTQGGSANPQWADGSGGTVTSVDVSGGTTGLTTSGGPVTGSGTITLAGTLGVANGGSGATALTGYLIGNGTGAFSASTTIPGTAISGDIAGDAANVTGTVAIANGGTGATDAGTALSNLGAAASGANSDITSLAGLTTALSETQGGTGLATYTVGDLLYSDASNSLAALAIGSAGEVLQVSAGGIPEWAAAGGTGTVTSVDVSGGTTGLTTSGGPVTGSGTITLAGTLAVANGGTGATTAAGARSNLSAAASGANSDITSLSGLTTPLTVAQGGSGAATLTGYLIGNGTGAFSASTTIPGTAISGDIAGDAANVTGTVAIANGGTGATDAGTALSNLGAAASGANSDITSLAGLTTALTVAQGGSGAASLTANHVLLGNGTSALQTVAPGSNGNVLTSNGTTWTSAAPSGGGANTALSNLSSVAINTALLPGAAGTIDLGAGTSPFRDAYLAGSSGTPGTNNFKITGAATASRTITLPDVTDTLVGLAAAQNITNKNIDSSIIGGATPAAGTFTNLTANTTLRAPNSATPSVTAAGQIAVDTDDDRITFYGSAARVVTSLKTKCATVQSLAASDDGVPIYSFQKASTLVQTSCYTTSTSIPTYSLEHNSGTAVTGAATCVNGANTVNWTSTSTNSGFSAGETLRFNTGTAADASSWTTICFVYGEDA